MATSSKVRFSLERLKAKALESLDLRIEQLRERVDNYDSDAEYTRLVNAWRADQKATIAGLTAKVADGTVTDIELEGFKMRPKPGRDRYQYDRDCHALVALVATRSKVVAKTEALVPDEAGNVSLTKTQLREFFDL